MKLVQKILSHGLLIAFVVAAFFIVTNRAELFPQWFAKSQASAGKVVSEKPATPVVPPARTVTRPLPEKTLLKKEGAVVEQAAPAVDVSASSDTPSTQTALDAATRVDEPSTSAPAAGKPAAVEKTVPPGAEKPAAPAVAEATPAPPPAAETAAPAAATPAATETLPSAAETPAMAETGLPPAEAPTAAESGVRGDRGDADAVTAWQRPEAGASSAPSTYRPLDDAGPAAAQPAAGVDTPAQPAAQQAAGPAAAAATPESSAAATAEAAPEPADTLRAGPTGAPMTAASAAQLEQQLNEVRALYWARDLRGAAAAYQSLGQSHPDNADVWGEIGNFYYGLRRTDAATAAYSRAIELLTQQGEQARARQLLDVLYRLDASAARELEMRLQQAGG